ncbi:MAG: alginate export family protein [Pseudomonadota bacterium]
MGYSSKQHATLLACRATLAGVCMAVCATSAVAEQRDPFLLHDKHGLLVRAHLQAGLNLVGEQDLFWSLSDIFATTAQYDPDKIWLEGYVKPGLSVRQMLNDHTHLYGKVSGVWSGTIANDAYDRGDTGRMTLEEAYAGATIGAGTPVSLDLSAGARELKLGTGMLFANGGSSGFERGALKFGPRKAWELTGIATLMLGGVSLKGFYLDPNEVPSNDAKTEIAGVDLRYDDPTRSFVGLTFAAVPESNSAYPQAGPGGLGPPVVTFGAREGLHLVNAYGRTGELQGGWANWFFSADLAYQWNDRINMEAIGGRAQVAYTFAEFMWRPRLMYTFQSFSGDDPGTGDQERFDPLFFEGSPSSWATGSKSAMTFINSNVMAHQVELGVKPTRQDTVTLRYAHIRANEVFSPVQFGQATRFQFAGSTNIVTGVPSPHLADDVFLEWSRIINRNTFFTGGVSASFPGKGLEQAAGRSLPVWLGAFANVVINY